MVYCKKSLTICNLIVKLRKFGLKGKTTITGKRKLYSRQDAAVETIEAVQTTEKKQQQHM